MAGTPWKISVEFSRQYVRVQIVEEEIHQWPVYTTTTTTPWASVDLEQAAGLRGGGELSVIVVIQKSVALGAPMGSSEPAMHGGPERTQRI